LAVPVKNVPESPKVASVHMQVPLAVKVKFELLSLVVWAFIEKAAGSIKPIKQSVLYRKLLFCMIHDLMKFKLT
jgi:hypothetical protein